jgi:hypothetical protein
MFLNRAPIFVNPALADGRVDVKTSGKRRSETDERLSSHVQHTMAHRAEVVSSLMS